MTQTATAEKPEMAGKKTWTFPIIKGKEEDIPVTPRTGGAKLPFDYDKMAIGDKFVVSVDFWAARGIAKTKNTAVANRDRIRRSFYNWQTAGKSVSAAEEKKRKGYILSFSELYDPKDKATMTAVEVYLARKTN